MVNSFVDPGAATSVESSYTGMEWPEGFWEMFSSDPGFEIHPALPPMPVDLDQS